MTDARSGTDRDAARRRGAATGDPPAVRSWRDDLWDVALDGRSDVDHQRRVIGDLLARGRDVTPAEVVAGLRARPFDTEQVRRGRRRLAALGARLVVAGDPAYPRPLLAAWPELGAPLWLFVDGGAVDLTGVTAVAVVGTRSPTLDGLRTTRALATALVRAGVVVVSGLARGIDQAAHRAALDAGGCTIAVLGTGLGVDYPARSGRLRAAIAAQGALLTELPPGVGPRPWQFLARNRIISGLAAATVVVEGGATSGALQTARMAAGQGRDVWAVPGSINAPASRAPLALLRDGALPLTSIDDLLGSLDLPDASAPASGAAAADGNRAVTQSEQLSDAARQVLPLLGPVPATTAALVAAGTLPTSAVLAAIAELVEAGLGVATVRGVVRA